MSKTIYVGNLPLDITEAKLRHLFEEVVEVQAIEFASDASGRFRGFAYLEVPDQDAEKAISTRAGCSFEGRTLKVSPATSNRRSGKRRSPGLQRW